MLEGLASGLAFGLSAGLAPGPLLALVVSQTLRHGTGHGIRVAAAPLLTDLPIIAASILLVGWAASTGPLLGVVALAGSLFVLHLARETWSADLPADLGGSAPRSLLRGVAVNLLSPHPYLFWLTVGAPTVIAAAPEGAGPVGAFVAAFYGGLIGSKVAIAVVTGRAGGRIGGPGYRRLMRTLALTLIVFAVGLAVEGIRLLGDA